MKIFKVAGLVVGLVALACSPGAPTPNIQQTVEAAVQATMETPTETAPPPPLTMSDEGDWVIMDHVDPLTDKPWISAILLAEKGVSTYGEPVQLLLRCKDGTRDIWIDWGSYLGSDRPLVTIRFGAKPATGRRWERSANNTATFQPNNAMIWFIKELITADQFVAQVTPYNESPKTAIFDLAGTDKVMPQVMRGCGVPFLEEVTN